MSHDRSACCRFCLEKRSIDATYDLFDQRVDKWLQRDLCQERGKRFIALISTLHKPENKRVSSEKWIIENGLTASKLPVSSNVKLVYPLIRWETIEMSVHVIQQRATETLSGGKEGDFFWKDLDSFKGGIFLTTCGEQNVIFSQGAIWKNLLMHTKNISRMWITAVTSTCCVASIQISILLSPVGTASCTANWAN